MLNLELLLFSICSLSLPRQKHLLQKIELSIYERENKKIYEEINSDEAFLEPSYMGIIPIDQNLDITENYLRSAIEKNSEFELVGIEKVDLEEETLISYELTIEYKETITQP